MQKILLNPFQKPFTGSVCVPGSKSITNRIFPLAVLCDEPVEIYGALESEDANIMRNALHQLQITNEELRMKNSWKISRGNFFEYKGEEEIFCGNSGTTIRFLTALCCFRKGHTILTGIERMKERPIGDLVDALRQMGAKIEYLEKEGFPPLKIYGNEKIKGGEITIKGNLSSQFLTALLHIAPLCEEGLKIKVVGELVSKPYITMTICILEQFGILVENQNFEKFFISSQKYISPQKYFVEGDASSSSYPLAIGVITGGNVQIKNIPKNSLQGDAKFYEKVVKQLQIINYELQKNEKSLLSNSLLGREFFLKPFGEINLEDMPDTAMTAVVLAAYAKGYSRITGLSTLRHKECDRIYALELNLKKMGADIKSGDDFIEINGNPEILHGAEIETFNDHRIAMCFAVLGSVIPNVIIQNPECVEKTYPTFWKEYEAWGGE